MKNLRKYMLAVPMMGLAMLGMMTSCESENEDTEPVDVAQSQINKQNPQMYQVYLENLRQYKKGEHKLCYVTFDNSAQIAAGRVDNLAALPDSVDVVALQVPSNVPEWQIDEMNELRQEKGTRFVASFDFDAVKLKYDLWKQAVDTENEKLVQDAADAAQKQAEETGEPVEPAPVDLIEIPTFEAYLVDTLSTTVHLVDQYHYDGFVFAYKGKNISHMWDDEKAEYLNYHNLFTGIMSDWATRNADKLFIIQGLPQNMIDKTLLDKASFIVLDVTEQKTAASMSLNLIMVCDEGVPMNKFVVLSETKSLDTADIKTGYWADGSTALLGTATWAVAPQDGCSILGIGVKNVSNDYYGEIRTYNNVRTAIGIINPSLK